MASDATELEKGAPFEIGDAEVADVRPLRSRYLRPDQPEDACIFESDVHPTARHFAARDAAGRILGVASLCFEDRQAGLPPYGSPGMRMRGLAVEDEHRGLGIGAALVAHMLEVGQAAGVVEAWAMAPTRNMRFYKRNRLKPRSSEFDVVGVGPHMVVVRNLKPARA